jgi:hypothetical protein
LPGADLGGVDIALPFDRDVVQRRELLDLPARAAEARDAKRTSQLVPEMSSDGAHSDTPAV